MEAASIIAAHIKACTSTSELHVPTPRFKTPRQGFSRLHGGNDTRAFFSSWTNPAVRGPQSSDGSIGSIITYLIGLFVWVQFGAAAYRQCLSMSQSDSIEFRSRSRVPSSSPQKEKSPTLHTRHKRENRVEQLFISSGPNKQADAAGSPHCCLHV